MLGVTSIIPMITARTEVAASTVARSGRIARWQRIAVSSAKQCSRAVVPEVCEPKGIRELVARPSACTRIMLVEPASSANSRRLREVPEAKDVTLLVGPEGGWDPEEIQTAAGTGIILATLGQQTLRADAAPLVALTALRVLWGDF
jgi:16S rRNA (uracil1498-N3)-methyltransferase